MTAQGGPAAPPSRPTGTRPLTWVALSRRALLAQRGVVLLVVVVVAVLSGLLAAWPRLEAAAQADQVRHRLETSSAIGRDVAGTVPAAAVTTGLQLVAGLEPPVTPETDAPYWSELHDSLSRIRDERPEPLRGATGESDAVAVTKELSLPINPDVDVRQPSLVLAGDARLADRVTLVDGRWAQPPAWDPSLGEPTGFASVEELPDLAVEIVVARETAERLGLTLGAPLTVGNLYADLSLVPVGTYEVLDPDATYWSHITAARSPSVVEDLNLGTSVAGVGYTATDGWWTTLAATREPATVDVWFDLDPVALDGVDPALLGSQLRAFTATDLPLRTAEGAEYAGTRLNSDLPDRLDAVASENAAVATIVLLVAVGPLGVAVAVLALLAGLLLERRRSALAMITARGASGGQLRRALALEGLALGLPAAALGWAAAAALVPGEVTVRGVVPSVLVALLPAAVLAASPLPTGLRRVRRDLRAGGWVRDAVVLVLAGLALAQVLAAPTGAVAGTGDLLLVLAPLVLALGVAVILLRLYPALARIAHAALRGSRSLPHFLGSARAVREPSASLTSVLAVVVGVSVTVFALVSLGTLRTGLERTVWVASGGDLRISGPTIDADQLDQVREIDGVAAAASVTSVTPAILQLPGESPRATLYLLDPVAYADVLVDVPAAVGTADLDLLAGAGGDGDAVGVLTSPRLGGEGDDGVRLVTSVNVGVDVLASSGLLPGVADTSGAWVAADVAALPELAERNDPRLLLVRLDPGADADAVATAVTDVIGPAGVELAGEARTAVADTPVFRLLSGALAVSVALAALLAVGSLVLVQATSAPRRAALLSRLRILGLTRAGERALGWWELLPWVALSVLAALALGLVTAQILLRPLDLGSFTQGAGQPVLVVDTATVALVGAAALAVAAVLSLVSTTRRSTPPPSEED